MEEFGPKHALEEFEIVGDLLTAPNRMGDTQGL